MPGWVSYRRVGYVEAWQIGTYVQRTHPDGTRSPLWVPIAIRRTKRGRERLLRYLRRQSVHHYAYRPIRVPR